jgi:uncharacterized membrane protein
VNAQTRPRVRAFACALVVCVPCVDATAQPENASLVRGFIQTGDASGIWTLRRCGDTADLPVKDQTPGDSLTVAVAEIKRAMQDQRRGVFVEFHGTITARQAVAKRLWRVLGYVADCAKGPQNVPADARFWASGSEAAWRLIARGKTATFTRFGHEQLSFAAPSFWPQLPRRTYRAQADSTTLTIEVEEQVCLDTLAETAYGARVTATVREKGQTQFLRGCAARF